GGRKMNGKRISMQCTCLLMATLTACSANRSAYVWHDLGADKGPDVAVRNVAISERWGTQEQAPDAPDPFIAPGFLVAMRSPDDKKLNGEFRVDFDGNLSLPYDQTVNASGLTVSDLEKKLTDLYRPYFKTSSSIKLHVTERRYWVDVRGPVQKPGQYL